MAELAGQFEMITYSSFVMAVPRSSSTPRCGLHFRHGFARRVGRPLTLRVHIYFRSDAPFGARGASAAAVAAAEQSALPAEGTTPGRAAASTDELERLRTLERRAQTAVERKRRQRAARKARDAVKAAEAVEAEKRPRHTSMNAWATVIGV